MKDPFSKSKLNLFCPFSKSRPLSIASLQSTHSIPFPLRRPSSIPTLSHTTSSASKNSSPVPELSSSFSPFSIVTVSSAPRVSASIRFLPCLTVPNSRSPTQTRQHQPPFSPSGPFLLLTPSFILDLLIDGQHS